MFKWLCLGVAVVFLSAIAWMVNDMRLAVKGVVADAEAHVPEILQNVQRSTELVNQHLPQILRDADQVAQNVDQNLPRILRETEKLLDSVGEMQEGMHLYQEVLGTLHPDGPGKELTRYVDDVFDFLGDQKATIYRHSKAGKAGPARAVGQWAKQSRAQARLMPLVAKSKGEVLQRICKQNSNAPYYIKVGEEEAKPLFDWLKAAHPASQGL